MENRQKSGISMMVLILIFPLVSVAAVINSGGFLKKDRKGKTFRLSIIAMLILSTIVTVTASGTVSTSVSMDDVSMPVGGSDSGYLKANNIADDVGSCELILSWDPAVVSVMEPVDGSDFDSMYYYLDSTAGILSITAISSVSLTGDFNIAWIEFEAVGSAGDFCDLEIVYSELLTADPQPTSISHDRVDGIAQIQGTVSTLVSMDDVFLSVGGSDSGYLKANNIADDVGSCELILSWDPIVVSVMEPVGGSDFDSMYYYLDSTAGILSITAISSVSLTGGFNIAWIEFEAVGSAGDSCDLEIVYSELLTADPQPTSISHDRVDGTAQIQGDVATTVSMDDVFLSVGGSDSGYLKANNIADDVGSCELILSWDPIVVSVMEPVGGSDFDSMYYYLDSTAGILSITAISSVSLTGGFNIAWIEFEAVGSAGDSCDLEIVYSELLTADPQPTSISHDRVDGTAQIQGDVATTVSMDDVFLSVGGSDSGYLKANNIADDVGSCELILSWDPIVVSVMEPVGGSDFDSMYYYLDSTAGILSITAISSVSLTGGFNIAWIEFEAVGSAGDSCDLEIVYSELLTADPQPTSISHDRVDGTAQIQTTSPPSSGDDGTTTTTAPNVPPISDASASQTSGFVGEPIHFDGFLSTDSDGIIASYSWDFDDGAAGNGETTTHTYSSSGTYHVTLTVTDDDGATNEDTIDVVITIANNPPTKPTVNGPTIGNKNTPYNYIAVSTDADNDTIQYTFNWDDGSTSTVTGFLLNGTATTQTHSWAVPGAYDISINAFDNKTGSGATKLTVLIDAYWVKDIGLLIDDDSDGTYDTFYSNSTEDQTDVEKQDDGTYLVDNDGDGNWDNIYDVETGTLTEYTKLTSEKDNTALYILAIIILLILIIIGYLLKRK